jgi:hypothetical protein
LRFTQEKTHFQKLKISIMISISTLPLFISIFLFIVGLFAPKITLFWTEKPKTRSNSAKFYILTAFLSLLFLPINDSKEKESQAVQSETRVSPLINPNAKFQFDANGNQIDVAEKKVNSLEVIPGLVPVDIHLNLENMGFTIDKEIGVNGCFYNCTKTKVECDFHCRVYGKNPSSVEEIKASYMSYTGESVGESAKTFLGYIATMPYDNSNPLKAKKWVLDHINKDATTNIGGVNYEMFARKNIRTLRIYVGE